jgi:hypothetical protein
VHHQRQQLQSSLLCASASIALWRLLQQQKRREATAVWQAGAGVQAG